MADEATLVVIKPEAIQRGLLGAVLSRLEELRLEIVGAKAVHVTRALAEAHYQALKDKPFYPMLLDHVQGKLHGTSYVIAFVFWGSDAIRRVRELSGATNPEQADPRSIRGQFGRNTASGLMENVIHASSTAPEAEREIKLWFAPRELLRPVYPVAAQAWAR